MQYFKYIGEPCNLGRFGAVKSGAILCVSDVEAETMGDTKQFKPVKSVKDEDPTAVWKAQCYDIAQQDRPSLVALAGQLKDDGYPIDLAPHPSIQQLIYVIQRALANAPDAFSGEYRVLYDLLAKLSLDELVAKGEKAGVAPDPKRHTSREIITAICKAKMEFDAKQEQAKEFLAGLKGKKEEDVPVFQIALAKAYREVLAKRWPLTELTPAPPANDKAAADKAEAKPA